MTISNGATTTLNLSLGAPVSYLYDELGRLVCVIEKDGNAATYAYDAVGNLLSISRQSPAQVSVIGFTPKNGLAGTSVNIYGTGFSTTASQNSVSFNGTAASVVASSPTLIVANVPSGATTGPISVTSPIGSATSTAAFTVGGASGAPTITSFTPTVGVAATAVTINGTNFDTTLANDRVSFNIMQSPPSSATATSIGTTVPTASTSGRISVSTPSGKAVSSADFFVPPSPYTAADVILTGRMAIGENRTITLSTANKIGLMLFEGTLGQKMCLNIVGVTIASSYVSIYRPDGSTLVSNASVTSSGKFIDTLTLPAGGTYTILINPQSYTGNMTLVLYNVVDIAGTISPGGAAITTTITTPGQNARYTFAGTSGQRVSLNMTSVTLSGSVVNIYKPDGSILAGYYNVTPPSAFIDTVSLPVTGTYSILVDPFDTRIGAMTLTLYNVVEFSGSTTVGGSAVTVALNTPGQNGQVTFSGTSGQQVTVHVTSNTIPGVTVKLLKPDGSQLTSTYSPSSSFNLAQQTLPTTGTYTIVIDPSGVFTGSLNVSVTSP